MFLLKNHYTPILHIIIWLLYILSPLLFFRGDNVELLHFSRHFVMAFTLMFIFYLNHFFILKKYFSKDGLKHFATINLCAIAVCCTLNFAYNEITRPAIKKAYAERNEQKKSISTQPLIKDSAEKIPCITKEIHKNSKSNEKSPAKMDKKTVAKHIRFSLWDTILNIFAYFCIVGVAVALHSITGLYQSEKEKKEEEKIKVEAELKNLKSQLNPHFLFNTLNNIYALIAISQEKSQEAVMDLSKMLRYVLYESEAKEVAIEKEINFINNYVKLMKLRLTNKVEVEVNTDISIAPQLPIAPLMFITLIENAFKHGVSSQEHSFIHFSILITKENSIVCNLENSYFPKMTEQDKSGSGIGLENLKRRLELIYPNRYTFTYGVKGKVYQSLLTINCPQDGRTENDNMRNC